MEILQLKEFVTIADNLSFIETAFQLDVSTSALSRHVQNLENELGCKLFQRGSRTVQLTDAGRTFLPHAVKMLADYEDGITELKIFLSKEKHFFNLGVSYSAEEFDTNYYIVDFSYMHPNYKPIITIGSMSELENGFRNKVFNVFTAVNSEYEKIDGMKFLKVGDCIVKAVVSANSFLSANKKITLNELNQYPLIMPVSGTIYSKTIMRCLSSAGVNPGIISNGRFEESIDYIRSGMGIGLFPFRTNKERVSKDLVFLDTDPAIMFEYGIGYRDGLSASERAFVEHIRTKSADEEFLNSLPASRII